MNPLTWKVLLGLLAIVTVGCNAAPTTVPIRQTTSTPTPSLAGLDLLQLGHERMKAVESFRAYLDIEIITGEEKGVIALNGRRGQGGPVSVIMTVEAPGAKQRHEMVLQQSQFYLKDDKQERVRHSTEDQTEIGAASSWAVGLASSIDGSIT